MYSDSLVTEYRLIVLLLQYGQQFLTISDYEDLFIRSDL